MKVVYLTMLADIWKNIEYYTKVKGMRKKDVYRTERVGKGISLNGIIEIAGILDIPLELLFESDKEITLEVAYAMICEDLGVSRRRIEQTIAFEKEMKRVMEVFS